MITGPWQRKIVWDWRLHCHREVMAAEVGASDPDDAPPDRNELRSQIAAEAHKYLLANGPASVTSIVDAIQPMLFQERSILRQYIYWHLWHNPEHFEVIGEVVGEGYSRPVQLWSAKIGPGARHTMGSKRLD